MIELDDLRAERTELAEATRNVFATPEFHETWWRLHGNGKLQLHAVFEAERLVGLLPFYAWKPGVLRALGHGAGDELGPIARPGHEAAVAAATRRLARTLLLAEHVPAGRLGGSVLRSEQSPVIDVASFDDWDAFLGSRSSNFRQQVRSRTRRLAREHDVRFREADAVSLDADLDTLFRLHRLRWPEGSEFADRERFHRSFARVGLERGWTSLMVLEVDGAQAAAWYGFRFADVDAYYQSGRDPAFDRESVGLVLLAHTIERAFADGRTQYRFLRGDEPYKFRFTDDDARVETVALGPAALAVRALLVSRDAARRLARSRRRARPEAASRPGE